MPRLLRIAQIRERRAANRVGSSKLSGPSLPHFPSSELESMPDINIYVSPEGWLVAPMEGAVFPNRCVKTNEKVGSLNYVFEDDIFDGQIKIPMKSGESIAEMVERLGRRSLFRFVRDFSTRKRLSFSIGLTESMIRTTHRLRRWGIALMIVGPAIATGLSLGPMIISESFPRALPPILHSQPFAMAALLGGLALLGLGVLLFARGSIGVLLIMFGNGEYVWLRGAGSDFLASLPESPVDTASAFVYIDRDNNA